MQCPVDGNETDEATCPVCGNAMPAPDATPDPKPVKAKKGAVVNATPDPKPVKAKKGAVVNG